MKCDEFRRDLHDYFTGDLRSHTRVAVERHGETCADCREIWRIAGELTCKEFVEFLGDYLEARLDPERTAIFERHLAICPDCAAYLQSYRAAIETAAASVAGERDAELRRLPRKLVRAVIDALERERS